MVYNNSNLVAFYPNLIYGPIDILAGILTIRKVYHGSKSRFAYLLLVFTLIQGVQSVLYFFAYSFY